MNRHLSSRLLSLLFCLVLVLGVFAGCNESNDDVTLDIEALAADLSGVTFVEQVEKLDADVIGMLYGFTSGAAKVVVYGASGATPEEIIVAEYATAQEAKTSLAKYQERLDAQKTTFNSYNPQYRYLLDTPIVEQVGKYVVYCVCDAQSAAQQILTQHKTAK